MIADRNSVTINPESSGAVNFEGFFVFVIFSFFKQRFWKM